MTAVRPPMALGLGEAAARLGVHPGTLRRWADAGAVSVSRTPGGQRRFSVDALDEFVASAGRVVPDPNAAFRALRDAYDGGHR